MDSMNEEIILYIFCFLDYDSKLNLLMASTLVARIFASSTSLLRKFKFFINSSNIDTYLLDPTLSQIPFMNFVILCDERMKRHEIRKLLKMYKHSAKFIKIKNFKVRIFKGFFGLFHGMEYLEMISLELCDIDNLNDEAIPVIKHLTTLSFTKCNANVYKAFKRQKSIRKIIISNDESTWNGFSHEDFNILAHNSTNLESLVFLGAGTGSYFDNDEFPFKIKRLETTMITYHWYVGIRTQRINFLQSQKGYLKHLTIHQLPNDFDGGRVLRYIIEEMELETFYLGKTALILGGIKQNVYGFEATEINVASIFEMFYQFSMIKFFKLVLSKTDIASDEIERIINPFTLLFNNLQIFELVDNSSYRSTFGVFLGFFKNLRNIKKLILRTADRNVNVILSEFLPTMTDLEEILLTSEAPKSDDRYAIIRRSVTKLNKLILVKTEVEKARIFFPSSIIIIAIE